MKKDKMAHIRNLLVKKMEDLIKSSDHTILKLKINNDKYSDPFDQAAVESGKDIELNCLDKEWHLILDIKETIMRIDYGLFGICDHCGRQISQKRLMAAPMSKLCVMCKEEIEAQQNKQTNRRQYVGRISYSHV